MENPEINIPICRAKNINGVENHIGLLKWNKSKTKYWINDFESGSQEIDPSTLAIHFLDMLDSDNKPIFASLSENGKGGSSVSFDGKEIGWIFLKDGKYQINDTEDGEISNLETYSTELKVTGIQE